jgi:hypothetical protein
MTHILPPGGARPLQRGGGPCPGLTDEDDRLAVRNARGIELRKRMIDCARDMSAGVFVRLTHIDDRTGAL